MDCAQVIARWNRSMEEIEKSDNLAARLLLHFLECREECARLAKHRGESPRFATSHAMEQIAPLLEP